MKCIGCKRQGDGIGGKGELRCLRHHGDQAPGISYVEADGMPQSRQFMLRREKIKFL